MVNKVIWMWCHDDDVTSPSDHKVWHVWQWQNNFWNGVKNETHPDGFGFGCGGFWFGEVFFLCFWIWLFICVSNLFCFLFTWHIQFVQSCIINIVKKLEVNLSMRWSKITQEMTSVKPVVISGKIIFGGRGRHRAGRKPQVAYLDDVINLCSNTWPELI